MLNKVGMDSIAQWVGPRVLTVVIIFFLGAGADAGEKITIGEVEDVILLPWGVKLPARIDTGAATSSLDARDLKVKENTVEFRLPLKYGGLPMCLPVVDWKHVRSSEARERRPVVEMEICLGPKRMRIKVNLNDRSTVKYPLIIGRNALKDDFVVDCVQSNCLTPTCPEALSR